MNKIKELFRLKSLEMGNRQIARSLNISHSRVGEIIELALTMNLTPEKISGMDEAELESLFRKVRFEKKGSKPVPDFAKIHFELRRKEVTLFLLWEEYRVQYPDGLGRTQFYYHYAEWAKKLSASMRQTHKAGEKTFVDFAGVKVAIINREDGSISYHPLFVGVLGASNYTYAEICHGEDIRSWINAHVHMFEYFGGTTEIIVPDNLKSGVTTANRYESGLNTSYLEMARYYGIAIIPARVAKPKDKAKVEVGVQIAERWVLAVIRNRQFFSIAEANIAVRELLEKLNLRPFKKLPGNRKELFGKTDQPLLKALPQNPYEFAEWKIATVNIDYHVEFERHYYSVPYQMIHKQVNIRATVGLVEIFYKGKQIACHQRNTQQFTHTTLKEHMPKSHREYAEWTPDRIISWAAKTGPETADFIQELLLRKPHPELGFRAAMGVIRLGSRFGSDRLEKACYRARIGKAFNYRSVENILKRNLDNVVIISPPERVPIAHENLWGQDLFAKDGGDEHAHTNN